MHHFRGGPYQEFSVRYDTKYFTFGTIDTIYSFFRYRYSMKVQDNDVDNIPLCTDIHTYTHRQTNYSKVLVQEQEHVSMFWLYAATPYQNKLWKITFQKARRLLECRGTFGKLAEEWVVTLMGPSPEQGVIFARYDLLFDELPGLQCCTGSPSSVSIGLCNLCIEDIPQASLFLVSGLYHHQMAVNLQAQALPSPG